MLFKKILLSRAIAFALTGGCILLLQHFLRQITLRIVDYHFSSQLTATLNLCLIYLQLLVHVL